jgi:hypothetical protein
MTKIHWLLPFNVDNVNQLKKVTSASLRMRLGVFTENIDSNFEISAGENIVNNSDILIIGKLKSPGNTCIHFWIDKIKLAKQNGAKIVIDYTDNHLQLNDFFYRPFYKELIPYIDEAVVSSSFLKSQLANLLKKPITVIEDAIDISAINPNIKNSNNLNILWFGHASNIDYLIKFINNWNNLNHKTSLYILSSEKGLAFLNQSQIKAPQNLLMQLGVWSIDNMIEAAKFCDLAIIPSNPSDPRKAGASSNRLITALALGLPTAADEIDSYKEFNKYFVNLRSDKFIDLLNSPNFYHGQVNMAQIEIVPNFAKQIIGQKWLDFFLRFNCS